MAASVRQDDGGRRKQTRAMAVAAAARNDQIERIDLIEVERRSMLGIFIRETVVVYGD